MYRFRFVAALVCLIFLSSVVLVPFANADWPMFHLNSAHTGAATSTPVLSPTVIWNYSTPGNPIDGSPAVVNGVVYIGVDGAVCALNATNGAVVWKCPLFDAGQSPTVVNGVVYTSGNYSMYALNATNGAPIWCVATESTGQSTPTVVNGIDYIGSQNHLYALNASNGVQIWNFTTEFAAVDTVPAVDNGVVFIQINHQDGYLHALNTTNGTEIWNYSTIGGGSPAVANGIVYLGTSGSDFFAFNETNGQELWDFLAADGTGWAGCPAALNGVVYMGCHDGNMYALNGTTGAKLWNYTTDTGWGVSDSPAVAGGAVYFGTWDGYVYALNATTGAKLWTFLTPRFGDNGMFIGSSPAVDNGVLYIASFYGCLYAFANSPAPTPTPTPQPTTASATPTPAPNTTPVPSTTPKSSPTPNPQVTTPTPDMTIQASINNSSNITLTLRGNITSSQMSSPIITTNQSAGKTTINFTVTGKSDNSGFGNITIPKSAVPYGTTPTIYIDNQKANNQGYSQDTGNYYVWYTTHFSTHEVSIVFSAESQNLEFPSWAVLLLIVLAIPIIAIVIAFRRHESESLASNKQTAKHLAFKEGNQNFFCFA
jgi:outer membrane protein assembly factor BamB